MSQNKKVLVTATNYSRLCAEAKKLLEDNGFEVIENHFGRPMEFHELKEVVGDVVAVVAGVDTWNEDVFKLAPKLKVISRFGVGLDNIDLAKAREFGIQVTSAMGANANAVAELAVAFIICAIRNIPNLHISARRGYWDRFVGREIIGRKIGLLGFGAIGQMVAKKLQGFDVEICAFDKYPNEARANELQVNLVSFEEVLAASDVVSMHLPSIKETYHIMNDETFSKMKKDSYFVNTARGALVDEKALYRALKSGHLAGAAIDVYEHEPITADNPLFELINLTTTPHTAGETYETYTKVSLITAQAIIDVFGGRTPKNLMN